MPQQHPAPSSTPLPSAGLEPPLPRLVVIPDRQHVCLCGKPLQAPAEIQTGECGICEVLNRFMPLYPCAGGLSPLKGIY